MQFTDTYGNTVELPKLTLELNEQLSKASGGGNDAAGFKTRYEFLSSILEADYLSQRLDGATISEVDLVELSSLFAEVYSAYNSMLIDDMVKPAMDMLEDIMPMLEKMERVNAGDTGQSRQVFNRIK